jgi:hypothetical protein
VSVAVTCQHCGKSMRVKESLAANLRFCPFCKGEIEVPQAAVSTSAASADKTPADPFAKPARPVAAPARPPVETPPSGSTGEGTVYADPEVMVTSARLICVGTSYALRNVTSARMEITPANRLVGILIIAVGAVLAVVGMFVSDTSNIDQVLAWAGAAVVLAAGIWTLLAATPDYHVAISSSSGEVRTFTSKDRPRVERIVAAINDAIVKYR